jgi:hypothetical protein
LSSSFGCDCCLCLHREDCHCKGGPPWPPTCLFPVDSTVCAPMVASWQVLFVARSNPQGPRRWIRWHASISAMLPSSLTPSSFSDSLG